MTNKETKHCPKCNSTMVKLFSYYLDIIMPYWLCRECNHVEDDHNHMFTIEKNHSKKE